MIILAAAPGLWCGAQQVITLKQCYDMAVSENAISGEQKAYGDISRLKDANIAKGWLPTLDANANFIYNSDVVDFAAATSAIPAMASVFQPMPHDQYKLTLDVNQVIYDGGGIKSARQMEQAELKVNEKQTETDLYKIRSQVNGYYFNILLLNRQKSLLENYLEIITKRLSAVESGIKNGILQKSDMDVVKSEKLKLEQQLTENNVRRNALMKILSGMTGINITEATDLVLPVSDDQFTSELTRPELQLFDLRKEQLSAGIKMVESKRMPRAFGFATLGYGNPPGQNFFNDSFDTYYIIGAGIKWNIFDWNRAKNEKQVISLQQEIIDRRKTDLSDNIKRQLDAKMSEIKSLQELVRTDTELIEMRKRITASAESQYENGTITATEYLNELNAEKNAVINAEIHKINLVLAGTEYKNISGKDIE